jgi:hypothetical protein
LGGRLATTEAIDANSLGAQHTAAANIEREGK